MTAFFLAVEEGNIEIIKLLLTDDKLDVNILNIIKSILFFKFKNLIFQLYSFPKVSI